MVVSAQRRPPGPGIASEFKILAMPQADEWLAFVAAEVERFRSAGSVPPAG